MPKKEPAIVKLDDYYFFKINRLKTVNDKLKELEEESKSLSDELKKEGKREWINLYEQTNENPNSIVLEASEYDDVGRFLYVPSDKYISVNEKKSKELISKFGDSIIEESTTYKFDQKMVDKWGDIISKLIEECDDILESDKEKIIKSETNYSIKKGAIDILPEFGNISEVFEEVKPVISIKSIEIIKS
jgi:hypothetical protein